MPQPTLYDVVPYHSYAYAQSHPAHLEALLTLRGMRPPPVQTCRVLEIGCAGGGNIVPMALTLPKATFLGIDASEVQVADGQGLIARLGLGNVQLRCARVEELEPDIGPFDYIVCHGVFSWVPAKVRVAILRLIQQRLSPQGAAFISYNAYPGWYARQTLREMLLFHVMHLPPHERIVEARKLMAALKGLVPNVATGALSLLQEVDRFEHKEDWYIFHELLEPENQAFYIREFEALAHAVGLRQLCDADPEVETPFYDPESEAVAKAFAEGPRAPQYMDFFHCRTFRESVVIHGSTPTLPPSWRRLGPLRLAARVRIQGTLLDPTSPESVDFLVGNRQLSTTAPLVKTALAALAEVWPGSLVFHELLATSARRVNAVLPAEAEGDAAAQSAMERFLAEALLSLYRLGALEIRSWTPEIASRAGDRPRAFAVALDQARADKAYAISLRHDTERMDPMERRILAQLDGETELSAILQPLLDGGATSEAVEKAVQKIVDRAMIMGEG